MATDKPTKIKLTTPEFRGSFVTLLKPRAVEEGGKLQYSIMIVLPKTSKETTTFVAKLRAALDAAAVAKFGKSIPEKALKHYPIRDGDTMEQEGFAGMWCIRAVSNYKPGAIDTAGNKLISEEDLYSGAWYRVTVDCWAWSHKTGGKGVSVNLNNVLKVRDDDKIGGGAKAEEDFASYIDGGSTEAEPETAEGGDDGEDLIGD